MFRIGEKTPGKMEETDTPNNLLGDAWREAGERVMEKFGWRRRCYHCDSLCAKTSRVLYRVGPHEIQARYFCDDCGPAGPGRCWVRDSRHYYCGSPEALVPPDSVRPSDWYPARKLCPHHMREFFAIQ